MDVIEAGFPIASRGDLEGVRAVACEVHNCTVAALARAKRDDIDVVLDGLKDAVHPRVHIVLATSDLHLQYKLRMTREQALEAICYDRAATRGSIVRKLSSPPRTRAAPISTSCAGLQKLAVEVGATIINLPDTSWLCPA